MTARITPRPGTYDADFIVVGSGAGGGTVAARLAEAGFQVLLLEAGGDPRTSVGDNPNTPQVNSLPDDYDVPAFHALSSENAGMSWSFWVQHYSDPARKTRDPHYYAEYDGKAVDGVFYPRAATLGGCTAHNALIFVYPNNADWNQLADLTGDPSWRAEQMRDYFEGIERCEHRPDERTLARLGRNPSRHGWSGWLQTETGTPEVVFQDRDLRKTIIESARAVLSSPDIALNDSDRHARLDSALDPNDWRVVQEDAIGLRYTPLTTQNHCRVGSRERLLDVAGRRRDRLKITLNAFATEVLFDDTGRAIGVEYVAGSHVYGADPHAGQPDGSKHQVYAAREVILAGGAFNTPQLLMLSGIGPRAVLAEVGIAVRVELDGVGKNLQDRYEVAVVNRMNFPAWKSLDGATFTNQDAQYREWAANRRGVYTSNGAILSVIARSHPGAPSPDLYLYALLGMFEGYRPGYSKLLRENPNVLTWVVLKAHTNNTAGEITLRSADPLVPPRIHFKYFDEGNDAGGADARAVAQGIRLARRFTQPLVKANLIAAEETPGPAYTDDRLEEFARDRAWGHHASCSCRIGRREDGGVLTSDFKVHGTTALRVVDASVFPRIPGFFIASAVYMVGEKAADVITKEARAAAALGPIRPFGP